MKKMENVKNVHTNVLNVVPQIHVPNVPTKTEKYMHVIVKRDTIILMKKKFVENVT